MNKSQLIKLGLLSFALDIACTFFEIPLLEFALGTIAVKEILEYWISSKIAGNKLQLSWFDRLLGLLPIPGITAVTVYVLRTLK